MTKPTFEEAKRMLLPMIDAAVESGRCIERKNRPRPYEYAQVLDDDFNQSVTLRWRRRDDLAALLAGGRIVDGRFVPGDDTE